MVIFSQCMDCKNYIGKKDDVFCCKAFPQGIPDDVLWNRINHEKNIDGDNGYKFESLYESTPQ